MKHVSVVEVCRKARRTGFISFVFKSGVCVTSRMSSTPCKTRPALAKQKALPLQWCLWYSKGMAWISRTGGLRLVCFRIRRYSHLRKGHRRIPAPHRCKNWVHSQCLVWRFGFGDRPKPRSHRGHSRTKWLSAQSCWQFAWKNQKWNLMSHPPHKPLMTDIIWRHLLIEVLHKQGKVQVLIV